MSQVKKSNSCENGKLETKRNGSDISQVNKLNTPKVFSLSKSKSEGGKVTTWNQHPSFSLKKESTEVNDFLCNVMCPICMTTIDETRDGDMMLFSVREAHVKCGITVGVLG